MRETYLKYDKKEDKKVYKELIDKASLEAIKEIEKANDDNLKNVYYFMNLKTKILKERYDIDWQSQDILNEDIIFG